MGAMAAELLLKRIGAPDQALEQHLYPGTLIVRDSVVDIRK
jgi:DNA-binding LacI/PurR family transcriptional regulator